jgi:amidase
MDELDLAFAGVARQAQLVRSKEVSPRELVELSLKRIERYDGELNSFRSVYAERAIEEAKAAGRKLRSKLPRPLLGVPVAIKDGFDVAGDVTTHGTAAYGAPAAADSEVVRRVREAGAIVVGKTHLPALAAMCTTESAAFGMTRNPWDTARTTGGSSGGSASAVAAGLVPAALASDGAGSIRIPAAFCGLVGLKPQRDRISLAPAANHWHGLTVAGWETRSVADSALMLDVTSGAAVNDTRAAPPPDRPFAEFAAASPGKLRIAYSLAVPPGLLGVQIDDDVRAALLETVEMLRALGHEVEERDPAYGLAFTPTLIRMMSGLADDTAALPHPERLERRARSWARSGRLLRAALPWALGKEQATATRLNEIFGSFDVLMTPVTACPAFELGRWDGRGPTWTLSGMARLVPWPGIWNQTGQPAASVPAGFTGSGLPLAVQLVGRPNDEGTLLSLAGQLEAERRWTERRPPL